MNEIKLPEKSRWTILSLDVPSKNKRKQALVKCECGTISIKAITYLKNGNVLSCGCLNRDSHKGRNKKHNGKGTRLYNIWKNMRQRCSNPNASGYKNYGAKGVKVCDEWNDFLNFEKWSIESGYSASLEIDRINSERNYEPINCRWVTKSFNSSSRNKDSKNRVFVKSRYSLKEVEEMRIKRKNGQTLQSLSQEYKCGISHIKRLIDGEIKNFKNKQGE